ncbi:MAG: HTTM domain-containing protein [Bacteroidota bacterium]|nr:HTTM domain-containing protein [Bacteroidota bacterium]
MSPLSIDRNVMRLFRGAIHSWLIIFIISSLPAFHSLRSHPISPCQPNVSALGALTNMFCGWADGYQFIGVVLLLIGTIYQLFRPANRMVAVLIWMIFTSLMNLSWLASSGGQQMISIMLFWLVFIPAAKENSDQEQGAVAIGAFWIMRVQLLIAYLSTALHKSTGTHWMDGTALGIVATDGAFGPAWIAEVPLIAAVLTWCILIFQFTFPIAVWFSRTRVPWMIAGVVFHLATAIWLKIHDMAFAFILCYAIWLDGSEAKAISDRLNMRFFRSQSERPERA